MCRQVVHRLSPLFGGGSFLFNNIVFQTQAVLKVMNVKAHLVDSVSVVVTATFAIMELSIIPPKVIL